jgi:two-component system response regulator AtoC
MLCDHFLKQFASESGTGAAKRIEPAALALLQAYPWPGNVRELRNAVERMTVLSRGDAITVADVPPEIREAAAGAAAAALLATPTV